MDKPLSPLKVSAHITVLLIININVHVVYFEGRLIRRNGRSGVMVVSTVFFLFFKLFDPLFIVDPDIAA